MKKVFSTIALAALVAAFSAVPARADVSVTVSPVPLVAESVLVKASSGPVALFRFSLSATAGETLSSVSVRVATHATTAVTGADIAGISVYKDEGTGTFSASSDSLLATQASVLVGSSTAISLPTTTPASGTFFVTLATAGSWSDTVPGDKVTVTLPAGAVVTSLGAVTTSATSTAAIIADTTAPMLIGVVAKNTGGTAAKEAGDSLELNFSEPTTKPAITAANIGTYFSVSGGHSFLSASGTLGSALWDEAGKRLTITLSGSTSSTSSLASIVPGDTVSVLAMASFSDLAGNPVAGTQSVAGSFAAISDDDDEDEDGDEDDVKGVCANGVINGRLYKIGSEATVYLAAACRLKPFRGQAVFKARGNKFENIITLQAKPANVSISEKPVLPADGTLIKGSDKTVWFVTKSGKRRGFVSGEKFLALGFAFGKVQQISDSDLQLVPVDLPIENNEDHPDGALIKCLANPVIYQVIGKTKFPFSNAESFKGKGHTFEHVLVVNCGSYAYPTGAPITE